MTEWVNQDVLLELLDMTQARLGALLEEGALPRARWNGEATLWNLDEVLESKFVFNPANYSSPIGYSGPSRVYFIAMHEFIKIGHAQSVYARFHAIQCSSPYEVTLLYSTPGGPAQEAYIHRIFATDRVRGEWFRKTSKLLALIEAFKRLDAKTNEVQRKMLASLPKS